MRFAQSYPDDWEARLDAYAVEAQVIRKEKREGSGEPDPRPVESLGPDR